MEFSSYGFLLLLVFSISTESLKVDKHLNNLNKHNEIKNEINKWWKQSANKLPIKCKDEKVSFPKIPIVDTIVKILIKSYTCPKNKDPSRYLFSGVDKSNYPEGKGKLTLISEKEWSKWSKEDKNKFNDRKICYDIVAGTHSQIKEIIGNFKNGSLHGPAKVVWADNSTVISKFKNGYLHGYTRTWNGQGTLIKAGYHTKGIENGSHWRVKNNHLIFLNSEMLNDEDKDRISLIFPILNNGSIGDPIAGTFLPYLDVLDDVYDAELTKIESFEPGCMLKVHYNRTTKKKSRYLLRDKVHIPFSFHQSFPLCENVTDTNSDRPDKRLLKFFEYVDRLIYGQNVFAFQDYLEGYRALWHLKPLSEELDKTRSTELISNIAFNETTKVFTANILGSERPLRIYFNEFKLNKKLELDGYCDISVIWDDRHLVPKDATLGWSPYQIRGIFKKGKMNGIAIIDTNSQSFGWVTMKENVMHGPIIFHGLMPVNPDQLKRIFDERIKDGKHYIPQHMLSKGTRFLGYYKNGHADGTFWVGTFGGKPYAHLHGRISNSNGRITGNNISYIYPDMETSFVGRFEDRVMKEAKYKKVSELKCDDHGIPYVSRFSDQSLDAKFYYEAPTNISFGAGPPRVVDPYEKKMVRLATSKIPNSGQGVFLKHDAKQNMIISLYDGYVFDPEEVLIYKRNCAQNVSKSDDERRHCNKYNIGIRMLDKLISIPPEIDVPDTFFPTLGQKINHNFTHNNTHFEIIDHPRWGIIQGVVANRDIKAGEELFGYYGYTSTTFPDDFPWYHDLKAKVEKEKRLKQAKDKMMEKKKKQTVKKKSKEN